MIRAATREDFRAYYGTEPPMTMRALVSESSTGILGFGGYYIDAGVAVVFTDNRPHMRKRDMVLGGRAVVELVKSTGLPAVARAGLEGDVAMRHFGFEPHGSVYRMAT